MIHSTFIQFEASVYKQIYGALMRSGLPVTPHYTIYVMASGLHTLADRTLIISGTFYFEFVDDIFTLASSGEENIKIYENISNFREYVKFIV